MTETEILNGNANNDEKTVDKTEKSVNGEETCNGEEKKIDSELMTKNGERTIGVKSHATNEEEVPKKCIKNSEHDEMQYLNLIQKIITTGKQKGDRTGLVSL